ncbi:S-layer homology domain-containing protein [Alkalihalophilus pseudofirmus]|uniref:S-layer homology domain-containing protein n=1 Tax=Alkalihalophilus pseudofirmus TaxID=79885 RepID=UPI002F405846
MKNNSKHYRKFLATAVTAAVIVPTVGPMATVEASAPQFTDLVEGKTTGYSDILELAGKNIINGYSDNTFRPNESINRQHVAVLLNRTLDLEVPENIEAVLSKYEDVDASHRYAKEIAAVTHANIFTGSHGKFMPNDDIKRHQMATVLVEAFDLPEVEGAEVNLTDIERIYEGHRGNVKILAQHGITTGKRDEAGGRFFDGGADLTRGQFAAFLNKSYKLYQSLNEQEITEYIFEDVKEDTIILSGKEFTYADHLAGLFQEENVEALKGAKLSFELVDNEISEITYLELRTSGTSDDAVTLDAGDSEINGSVYVDADYVELLNVSIKGDLVVGYKSESSFYAKGITVEGDTVIEGPELAANSVSLSSTNQTITFEDSELNTIEINSNGATVETKGSSKVSHVLLNSNATIKASDNIILPKVTVSSGASHVNINGEVEDLEITTGEDVQVSGEANIQKVTVSTDAPVQLNTTGTIETLDTSNSSSKITLGESSKVTDLVLKEGTKAEDVISNYDEKKDSIGKIDGEENPDVVTPAPPAPPVQPPVTPGPGTPPVTPIEVISVPKEGINFSNYDKEDVEMGIIYDFKPIGGIWVNIIPEKLDETVRDYSHFVVRLGVREQKYTNEDLKLGENESKVGRDVLAGTPITEDTKDLTWITVIFYDANDNPIGYHQREFEYELIYLEDDQTEPAVDTTPSATTSDVTVEGLENNEVKITMTVKNAEDEAITELTAGDFTVNLRGQSYVVGSTDTFKGFKENGNGEYEVIFAPGFPINETVDVVAKDVTIITGVVVNTSGQKPELPVVDTTPSATTSDVTVEALANNEVKITMAVKNAANEAVTELTADDFTVNLRDQSYVVGSTGTFKEFKENGKGEYEVIFAPGFPINETVDVVAKDVTIITGLVVNTSGQTPGDPTGVTPVVDTAVGATAVTEGQALSNSQLSGTFKVSENDDTAVAGTLTWDNPTTTVNMTGNFTWTFTPEDTAAYNLVKGEVEVVANSESDWNLDDVAQSAKSHMEENETIGTYKNAYPVADLEYVGGLQGTLTATYTKEALKGYRDYRNGADGNFDILAGMMNDFARYFKSLYEQEVEVITYEGIEYTWDPIRGGASKYVNVNNGTTTTLVSAVVGNFVTQVSNANGDYIDFTFAPFEFTINGQTLTWVSASSEWEAILDVFHGEKWPLDEVAQGAKTHMEENETIGTYKNAYPVADLEYAGGLQGKLTATYTKEALKGYRDYRNGADGNFDILAGMMNDFARYFKSLHEQEVEVITYEGIEYTWDPIRGGASKYVNVNNGTTTTLVSAVVGNFVTQVSNANGNYTDFAFAPFEFTINGQTLTWLSVSSEWEAILDVFHNEKWPTEITGYLNFGQNFVISEDGVVRFV